MDDAFFVEPNGGGRKKKTGNGVAAKSKGKGGKRSRDEEIDEDIVDFDKEEAAAAREEVEEEEEEEETVADKRLRLAKEMLARAEAHERDVQEDEEISTAAIAHRLKRDLMEEKGNLRRQLADAMAAAVTAVAHTSFRAHRQPITCVVVSSDGSFVVTAGKDGDVVKWSMAEHKRLVVFEGMRAAPAEAKSVSGHVGHVLALALSSDDKLLVSGGRDKKVIVWDLTTHHLRRVFSGHQQAVAGLAFRRHTHTLFSSSYDGTVKIWNLDELAYVETLYGHESAVVGVASLDRERAVSVGSGDHSLRYWKVAEESQLVFQGGPGSMDCVAMLTENNFATGAQDGTLCLWDILRKKPTATVRNAHGPGGWIASVGALPYADIVASGGSDGHLRIWKVDAHFRSLSLAFTLPVAGFINAIVFPGSADSIVVAAAQEHRLGRWEKVPAKSSVHVFTFSNLPDA